MRERIVSFTLQQILKAVDPDHIHHAEYTAALKEPFLIKAYGSSLLLGTNSSHYAKNHKVWMQKVIFKDFIVIARDKQISIGDAVHYAIEDLDIHVKCDCPAFLYYGYKYMATKLSYLYGLPKENRPPKIRNPQYRGTVCKHSDKVLRWIVENEDEVVRRFEALYRKVDFAKALEEFEEEHPEQSRKMAEDKRKVDAPVEEEQPEEVPEEEPEEEDPDAPVKASYIRQKLTKAVDVNSPQFKAWFDGSVVVDDNRDPMPVYHFSANAGFTRFSSPKGDFGAHFGTSWSARDRSGYGDPFHYDQYREELENEDNALARADFDGSPEFFATEHPHWSGGKSHATYKVYLSIKKPIRVNDHIEWSPLDVIQDIIRRGEVRGGLIRELKDMLSDEDSDLSPSALVELFQSYGYDGFVYENRIEDPGKLSYCVFSPAQVKSALSNTGEFQGENIDESRIVSAAGSPLTESSEFRSWFGASKAVDGQGQPLVVYRGEHGTYHEDEELTSRLGTYTFAADPESANLYATEPNRGYAAPEAPRVYPVYVRIEKPFLNTSDDPFVDISHIEATLGREVAEQVALAYEEDILDTGSWRDNANEDGEYEGIQDLIENAPEKLGDLCFFAFRLMDGIAKGDDPVDLRFLNLIKAAGYDGAIHMSFGDTHDDVEYRVFGRDQVKSIYNFGGFSREDTRLSQSAIQSREISTVAPSQQLLKRAIKQYGLTEDYFEAFFITPTGEMLSGKTADGGMEGVRDIDHHNVEGLLHGFNTKDRGNRSRHQDLLTFMQKSGCIRVDFAVHLVDSIGVPNRQQIRTIYNAPVDTLYFTVRKLSGDIAREYEMEDATPTKVRAFYEDPLHYSSYDDLYQHFRRIRQAYYRLDDESLAPRDEIYYHGGNVGKDGKPIPNGYGLIFLTPSLPEASLFRKHGTNTVHSFVLTAGDIFDGFNKAHLQRIGEDRDVQEARLFDSSEVEDWDTVEKIKAAGFDGFYTRDYPAHPDTYGQFRNVAVFSPDSLHAMGPKELQLATSSLVVSDEAHDEKMAYYGRSDKDLEEDYQYHLDYDPSILHGRSLEEFKQEYYDVRDKYLEFRRKATAVKRGDSMEPEDLAKAGFTEDEFAQFHSTGNIPDSAYTEYQTEEWWDSDDNFHRNRSRYPRAVGEITLKDGTVVDVLSSEERLKYVKHDEDGDIVRGADGLAIMLSDEEMEARNLPLFDTTLYAFDGDRPVAWASDEFGTDGVWVRPSYQGKGLGTQLLRMFRRQFKAPRGKMGQMTYKGQNLARAYYRKYASQAITQADTGTQAFSSWFRGSKVVDEDGQPLAVYHGTTQEFRAFKRKYLNPQSDWGAGFYFSGTPEDVGHNYAGLGPDLESKIELEYERHEDYDYNSDPEEQQKLKDEVRRKYMAHEGSTFKVYLRIIRPLIVGGRNETFFDYSEPYYEGTDEYGEPKGLLVRFITILDDVVGENNYYERGDVHTALYEAALDYEGVYASDLVTLLKGLPGFAYLEDPETGDLFNTEFLRRTIQRLGFDGIIDYTVDMKFGSQKRVGKAMEGMDPDTVHYVVFSPNQIKSVWNTGEWSRKHDIGSSLIKEDRFLDAEPFAFSGSASMFTAPVPTDEGTYTIIGGIQPLQMVLGPMAEHVGYSPRDFAYEASDRLEEAGIPLSSLMTFAFNILTPDGRMLLGDAPGDEALHPYTLRIFATAYAFLRKHGRPLDRLALVSFASRTRRSLYSRMIRNAMEGVSEIASFDVNEAHFSIIGRGAPPADRVDQSLITEAVNHEHYKDTISKEDFDLLMTADPTQGNKLGKWFMQLYKSSCEMYRGMGYEEDEARKQAVKTLYHVATDPIVQPEFALYAKAVERKKLSPPLNNIMNFSSPGKLHRALQESPEWAAFLEDNDLRNAAKEIEVLYEDSEWFAWIPKTYQASCAYGKGTEWCTATGNTDFHWAHYSDAPLIDIKRKSDGYKWQLYKSDSNEDWEGITKRDKVPNKTAFLLSLPPKLQAILRGIEPHPFKAEEYIRTLEDLLAYVRANPGYMVTEGSEEFFYLSKSLLAFLNSFPSASQHTYRSEVFPVLADLGKNLGVLATNLTSLSVLSRTYSALTGEDQEEYSAILTEAGVDMSTVKGQAVAARFMRWVNTASSLIDSEGPSGVYTTAKSAFGDTGPLVHSLLEYASGVADVNLHIRDNSQLLCALFALIREDLSSVESLTAWDFERLVFYYLTYTVGSQGEYLQYMLPALVAIQKEGNFAWKEDQVHGGGQMSSLMGAGILYMPLQEGISDWDFEEFLQAMPDEGFDYPYFGVIGKTRLLTEFLTNGQYPDSLNHMVSRIASSGSVTSVESLLLCLVDAMLSKGYLLERAPEDYEKDDALLALLRYIITNVSPGVMRGLERSTFLSALLLALSARFPDIPDLLKAAGYIPNPEVGNSPGLTRAESSEFRVLSKHFHECLMLPPYRYAELEATFLPPNSESAIRFTRLLPQVVTEYLSEQSPTFNNALYFAQNVSTFGKSFYRFLYSSHTPDRAKLVLKLFREMEPDKFIDVMFGLDLGYAEHMVKAVLYSAGYSEIDPDEVVDFVIWATNPGTGPISSWVRLLDLLTGMAHTERLVYPGAVDVFLKLLGHAGISSLNIEGYANLVNWVIKLYQLNATSPHDPAFVKLLQGLKDLGFEGPVRLDPSGSALVETAQAIYDGTYVIQSQGFAQFRGGI